MTTETVRQIRAARRSSTPLLYVQTADPSATIAALVEAYADAVPILGWDVVRGIHALNEAGRAQVGKIIPAQPAGFPGLPQVNPTTNPVEALTRAMQLDEKTILAFTNAHRLLTGPAEQNGASYPPVQAIANLRDAFKMNQRTLIMLGPAVTLPRELVQDVMIVDEPYPTRDEIRAIVSKEIANFREAKPETPDPEPDVMTRSVEALAGLAAFPIEQSTALSLASFGKLDPVTLWARKAAIVGQNRGLTFEPMDGPTLDDLGGLDEIRRFGYALEGADPRPTVIVRIEEIEKALAGSGSRGDSSGVTQDQLGTILTAMEDRGWEGLIAVGPPGSGKSEFSKTLGRSLAVPTVTLDLGALKGSLVGQSEENVRTAMKVIDSIAGRDAYFVASSNGLDVIPDALRRRFTSGIWFFDLPTTEERDRIWTIQRTRHKIAENDARPDDAGWTGAEIRNCCRLAARLRKPLAEAARWILPVSISSKDSIEQLRKAAHGKYFSASYAGAYREDVKVDVPPQVRRYTES